jgi:hypothetical protein
MVAVLIRRGEIGANRSLPPNPREDPHHSNP